MMTFTYENEKVNMDTPVKIGDFVKLKGQEKTVLACKADNVLMPYDYIIRDGDDIVPVTIESGEGYMIYKETIVLLLLYAAESMQECNTVFVRQSVNKSTYFEVDTNMGKDAFAKKIKERMKSFINEDISIVQSELPKEKVAEIFRNADENKRAKDIELLPKKKIRIAKTEKSCHIMFQQLAYSIKAVDNFDVLTYDDGFLLKYPTNYTIDTIPDIKSGQKVHRAIEDYRDWITTIGAEDVFSINRFIKDDKISDIVNLSEGLHEKRISRIADKIKESPDIKFILIAGPSSSGKTTFANRLCLHLRINHINPIVISLDDYYVNDEFMPRDEKGEMDFECVEAIDYQLFNKHLEKLAKGETVSIPKYDFNKRCRVEGRDISIGEGQILIVEGIHALNELLTSRVERKNKYKIYLSALTSLCLDEYNAFSPTDNRLIRRMVRDAAYRNTTAAQTFKLWKSVRKGEQKYIFPFESEADEVFNSSLVYELAVLKEPALKLLDTIGKDSEHYTKAVRLKELLSYFEEMTPECIPPTSIIREFIGGSTISH